MLQETIVVGCNGRSLEADTLWLGIASTTHAEEDLKRREGA
jgi:hypothetical protein